MAVAEQEAVRSKAPKSEYIEFWNEILVPKFIRWKHIVVDGLTLHSAAVFPTLAVRPGDRVIDAGCGFGDTAIQLARLVGPGGSVLAIDCCDAFLEYGRRDAAAAGIGNVTFVEEDVQTCRFQPVHDFCFSRFGTQFFENPVAGLRNMRSGLRPGGIMTMIVWRDLAENPWLGLPKEVILRYLPPPGEDARTCGPGPFSMADPEVVAKQLQIAGYVNPEFERVDVKVLVGPLLLHLPGAGARPPGAHRTAGLDGEGEGEQAARIGGIGPQRELLAGLQVARRDMGGDGGHGVVGILGVDARGGEAPGQGVAAADGDALRRVLLRRAIGRRRCRCRRRRLRGFGLGRGAGFGRRGRGGRLDIDGAQGGCLGAGGGRLGGQGGPGTGESGSREQDGGQGCDAPGRSWHPMSPPVSVRRGAS